MKRRKGKAKKNPYYRLNKNIRCSQSILCCYIHTWIQMNMFGGAPGRLSAVLSQCAIAAHMSWYVCQLRETCIEVNVKASDFMCPGRRSARPHYDATISILMAHTVRPPVARAIHHIAHKCCIVCDNVNLHLLSNKLPLNWFCCCCCRSSFPHPSQYKKVLGRTQHTWVAGLNTPRPRHIRNWNFCCCIFWLCIYVVETSTNCAAG